MRNAFSCGGGAALERERRSGGSMFVTSHRLFLVTTAVVSAGLVLLMTGLGAMYFRYILSD
jgi:hypothetical protein